MKVYFPAESALVKELVQEVWDTLGGGFTDDVYADALEYEFTRNAVPYTRNPRVDIYYKDTVLPHTYVADFIVFGKIILRVTALSRLNETHTRELLTILKGTKNSLAIYINFAHNMPNISKVIAGGKFVTGESLKEAV